MISLLMALVMLLALAACGTNKADDTQSSADETPQSAPEAAGIDYLALVNKLNPLP